MSQGRLIGPRPQDGIVLNSEEFEAATNLILAGRSDKFGSALCTTLKYLTIAKATARSEGNLAKEFFSGLMTWLGSINADEIHAVFADKFCDPDYLSNDEGTNEAEYIAALLKLVRGDTWLGDFLRTYLPLLAQEQMTPTRVLSMMSAAAEEFETDLAIAQRMFTQWPELVQATSTQTETAGTREGVQ